MNPETVFSAANAIAHALGLHGLQAFPLLGFVLAARRRSARWLFVALPAWLALIAPLHLGALDGRPLVSM